MSGSFLGGYPGATPVAIEALSFTRRNNGLLLRGVLDERVLSGVLVRNRPDGRARNYKSIGVV